MDTTKNIVHIYMCASENIIEYTTVSILSIAANTKSNVSVTILENSSDLISNEHKMSLKELESKYHNLEIKFTEVNPSEFSAFAMSIDSHVSIDTYFRYLIPNLDTTIDKCIYIDYDTICIKDIQELYDEDLKGNTIGAICQEKGKYMTDRMRKIIEKTQIKDPEKYFNAGVLLIDCKKAREINFKDLLFDTTIKLSDKIEYADQDVLNIVFENDFLELPEKYNTYCSRIKNIKDVNIIHYVGKSKPWSSNFTNSEYFWKYARLAPSPINKNLAKIDKKVNKNKILKRIFSIKNKIVDDKKYKIITIFGAEICLNTKNKGAQNA